MKTCSVKNDFNKLLHILDEVLALLSFSLNYYLNHQVSARSQ